MKRNVTTNLLRQALITCFFLATVPAICSAQSSIDRDGPLFFVGLTGEGQHGENNVLLRWYSIRGEIPFSTFSVYRKAGNPHDPGSFTKLSTTRKIRNIPLIRSIFERDGAEPILQDIIDILDSIDDTGVTQSNYATRLIELLDGNASCQSCTVRGPLLAQSNYGVAIVEGLGYLDRVTPGTYTYELRTSINGQQDNLVIGRITIDASTITVLPSPMTPEETEISGSKADRKVFLRWDMSSALQDNMPISFGFNVYRYDGVFGGADTFEDLEAHDMLQKVNRLPIMLTNQNAEGSSEDEHYDFMDDNLSFDPIGRLGDKFTAGDQYTYWVAARDLLGQRGTPSDPVIVTIKDRKAPAIPRGLRVIEDRVSDDRRLTLEWAANQDTDTVIYKVFRYHWYHNTRRTTPDTDIAYDMTEGYIATVPQIANATVAYTDIEIELPDHEGIAYWYCIAAEDGSGNMSPLSPPVRGVLYDRVAPIPPKLIEICTTKFVCDAKFFIENTASIIHKRTDVVFTIERMDPRITAVKVVKEARSKEQLFYRGLYGKQNVLSASETVFYSDDNEIAGLGYFFSFRTVLGEWCGPYELPQDIIAKILSSFNSQVDIRVQVNLHPETVCRDALIPGRIPHVPVVDGNTNSVLINLTLTDDAVGASLYRAVDCDNYQRISSVRAEDGETSVTLTDTLRPGSTQVICYGIRTFDGSSNASGMTYLNSQVVFTGNETITPEVDYITSFGTESNPEIYIRWFGAYDGIAGYQIHFSTGTFAKAGAFGDLGGSIIGDATAITSTFAVEDLGYSESTGLWSVQVDALDDIGGHPVETNTYYRIWVSAIDHLGNITEGKNSERFIWSTEEEEIMRLSWPVRDLPEHTDGVQAATHHTKHGVMLKLSDPPKINDEIDPFEYIVVNAPFIVYRKRVDIAGQPYVQIGPLIDKIQTDPTNKAIITDSFIINEANILYYMDYVGLVFEGEYQYVIVELDDTGELSLVRDPSAAVKVDFQ